MSSCLVLDTPDPRIWFAVIFAILGIMSIAAAGITNYMFHKRICNCTATTTGTVTDNYEKSTDFRDFRDCSDYNSPMISYYPVFTYSVNGTIFSKMNNVGTAKPTYTVGQQIMVKYNPENPDEFYLPEKTHIIVAAIIHTVGVVCVLAAIIVICI